MKTYVTILIGIVVLCAVVYGGYTFIKRDKIKADIQVREGVQVKTFSGEVSRFFEGENKIIYSFNIPNGATTTLGMDGALIKITNATSSYASIYISYEGGRGYTPINYIDNIISPRVSVINPIGIETIGVYEWQKAVSEGSEWYIASVLGGEWLIVVENKKSLHDAVRETLMSIKVE